MSCCCVQNLERNASWPFVGVVSFSQTLVFSFYQSHDSVTVHHYSKAKNSKKQKHQLSEEEIKANLRKTVREHFYFITGTLSGTVNI